ncbi:hypothetical protein HOLleu_10549 [Holothuria leucospilota]|uniref:Uncharacterized protein n=1 Tax=Holothuria leucospilota TaxID=206669 RepID=A0A9Q1CDB6_HOLLE|nr:hypothetical protein HOLleu_10549 [Holothuria leucospilota]
MTEVLQNEIKKKQQPLLQDHAEAIQELRDEISQLKTEKKQLEMENRNLRKTIQLMKDLLELLSEVKKSTKDLNACRQASSKLSKIEESAEVEGVQYFFHMLV